MAGKGREMAKRHLSKCPVVCFVSQRAPTPSHANDLRVYFLGQVERSVTNAEGMSEGSTPTMSDQNAIDPCECAASTIDHICARESRQKNKGSDASARIARTRLCNALSLGVHRLDQVNQSRRVGAAGHFLDTSVEGFIEAESAFQESEHDEGDWMDLQRVVCTFYMMRSWSSMGQWQGPALCQAQTAARYFLTTETETGSKGCNVAQARSIGHIIVKGHRRGTGSSASEYSRLASRQATGLFVRGVPSSQWD
ncbi:uncharacterized protein HD556DRAFT_1309308 [Suillus plorans]|uniref:Uncharacterized protein n=1 Tax=Suillus plorans TaxID=116603 RepID=A0A9P7API5_9AGAM|nr:uncharacterized protein HD556DRAFT_1309308 [Suillus plorans]KAG1792487.1 hypothetical protein HD556DRAFT_1309308 [Suillus plorans]